MCSVIFNAVKHVRKALLHCYDSFEAVTFLYYAFLCRMEGKTHHKLQKLWTHSAQPLCRQGRGKERYRNRQYCVFIPSLCSATMMLNSLKPWSVSQSASSVTWSDLITAIHNREQQLAYLSEINTLCNCVAVLKQMASAVWSCSWSMNSITFEGKKFPVCVHDEESRP